MKRLILILLFVPFLCAAQDNIPKRLLKGITVTADEFNGSITYRTPFSDVYIVVNGGEPELRWELSCNGGQNQMNLQTVSVLVAGEVQNIPFSEEEHSKFTGQARTPQLAYGSKPGQSAYTFNSVNQLIEKIDVAADYGFLHKIVATGGAKIKFSGDHEATGEYQKKQVKAIRSILSLYDFLTE